jgi:hypothetical protein
MAGVQIKLDRRFYTQAKGVIEKYSFDVGVLRDGSHKNAVTKSKGLKSFAGGPARRTGRRASYTLSEVSESLRNRTGINFYTRPFRAKKNRDILLFMKRFFDLCAGRGEAKRLENALQAIVRNPILRGDYGSNSAKTVKAKGFNRLMIDTAQLFRSIKAKVSRRRVS